MARLTDQQKKILIAEYVECGSYNAVAKKYGIADTTVRRAVMSDANAKKKAEQKKEQNTMDMLAFMESRKQKTQDIIDQLLDAMPERIRKASLMQVTTAYGILVDKSTMLGDNQKQEGVKVVIDVGNKTK